jgi:hypothetical protein
MNPSKGLLIPILIFLFSAVFGYFIHKQTWYEMDKHFSLQALAFTQGDIFLNPINLPKGDIADYKARQYVFHGPLPSIMLVPAVYIFGKNFPQITLSIGSLVIIYISILLLTKKLLGKESMTDALWLANFFVFGSVLYFASLINISAYIVQVVATMFLVLALLEYFTRRRWLVLGILIAACGLTRISLYAASIFFVLEIVRLRDKIPFKLSLASFILPIFLSILLWGGYNYRRFHSVLETGYQYNITLQNWPLNSQIKHGLFSLEYIPTNLYSMLIRGPIPILEEGDAFILKYPYLKTDGWGMAIWVTSPLFLYLFKIRREKYTAAAIVTILFLALPSVLYFGIGFSQFGYRYSLDFLPFLLLILIPTFKDHSPKFAKILIVFGIVLNFILIFNTYF